MLDEGLLPRRGQICHHVGGEELGPIAQLDLGLIGARQVDGVTVPVAGEHGRERQVRRVLVANLRVLGDPGGELQLGLLKVICAKRCASSLSVAASNHVPHRALLLGLWLSQ
jgi:hypothetical protein